MREKPMTEDELLSRYGLVPEASDAPAIRDLLRSETANENREGNEFLKTLCIQLFALGDARDALLIWKAKQSSFDAACYIDIQLLCGSGLSETKDFLSKRDAPGAKEALARIVECEEAGDLDDFNVAKRLDLYRDYYGIA
jgi:hypothetical protein